MGKIRLTMAIKKGDIVYKMWINVESELKEKSTLEIEEWHITKIDKRGIFLRQKDKLTWGKLSKKQGDYGWLPNVEKWVRDYYFKKLDNEEELNNTFTKSKSAAYRTVLMQARKYKKDATRILTQVEKGIKKHSSK